MRLADLRLRSEGAAVIATVSGEVDMSNVREIQAVLGDGTPNDAAGLIIDLTGLDYLDSAGIQLLFRLHSALRTRAQALVLVVPDGSVVGDTFRLAGVSGRIPVANDLRAALAAVTA